MARFNPTSFDTANPLYAGATVTLYTVDGNGAATTTLATIYDATTGLGTLANPQILNSEGRFSAPVYLAEPVIMTISGPVTTHSTGIQAPSVRNRGTWATATLYSEGDIVRDGAAGANTGNTYLCEVRHTSGTWATDLTAVRWSLFTDLSTQTAAAAASAAAADASAIAAAASAASITIPLPIASGGTGATDAAAALAALGAQPADSDLTEIAGLGTEPFGRSLLTQADAAAARSTLGITASSGAEIVTAGENLADRDLIYQDVFNQRGGGADRWYEVDTDATGPVRISPRIGIALAAITSGATGNAQVRLGRVSGFSGLTTGQAVFASATAGAVTQTAPAVPASGTQNASRLIGYAASATEIDFDPEDDTVFTARNSALAVDGTVTVQHWTDAGARDREQGAYIAAPGSYSANVATGGTALSGGASSGVAANVFDGNTGTVWASSQTGTGVSGAAWIGYDMGAGNTREIRRIVLTQHTSQAQNRISSGLLQSSPDGSTWTTRDTLTLPTTGAPETINCAASGAFRYWRLLANANLAGSDPWAVFEMQMQTLGAARDEPVKIGSATIDAAATDCVAVRYDDGAGANADTRTTFINRTNATRDLAVEVVL
jgi:hypothetical protein